MVVIYVTYLSFRFAVYDIVVNHYAVKWQQNNFDINTSENVKQAYRMGRLVYWSDRDEKGKMKIRFNVDQKDMPSNDNSLL